VTGEQDNEDGSITRTLVTFGALAAVLLAILGAGLVWRTRHGE
jgi:hypothetical protein